MHFLCCKVKNTISKKGRKTIEYLHKKGWNNKENDTKRQSLFGDVPRRCPYQLFEQVGEVLR